MTDRLVLVLGGTTEARKIADVIEQSEGLRVLYSLAGVTKNPLLPSCEVRTGGFGGQAGLESFMRTNGVSALIDATHPYATTVSNNAVRASKSTQTSLLRYERTPWKAVEQDNWRIFDTISAAANSLLQNGSKVFLAIGKKEISPFKTNTKDHFFIRSVEEIDDKSLPVNSKIILDRGPFELDAERALLLDHKIDRLVCKNSGGTASFAKLEACRDLGIPVLMIERPELLSSRTVTKIDGVLTALRAALSP